MSKPKISQYEKMTKTPIPSLIIKLSIPTIISMLITNIYNLADTAFVGKLGNSASGAVGIVFGFMAILQAIGFMFGQGSGSIISRTLGQKDKEEASRVASIAFFLSLAAGLLIAVLSLIFMDSLVMILGSTKTIAPYAKTYISFILIAAPFMTSSFVLNNILRYEGKAMLGMIGLMTGAILNIICDPILMFGLKLGIAGAGISTAISQFISFCILLSMFLRKKTSCKLSIKRFTLDIHMILNIMATGMPSLLRQGLGSLATVVLNACAGIYGDEAVAAMSIVSRISFFVFSFALGIGQGFQPVSGFNFGAKKYDRLRKAYFFTLALAESLMVIAMAIVLLNAKDLLVIFRDDQSVVEIATRALYLQCFSMIFIPPCMITEMLLQSTGEKLGASILSSLRSGLFFIPALIILSQLRGLAGIQEAQPLANLLGFVPAVIYAVWFLRKLPKLQ